MAELKERSNAYSTPITREVSNVYRKSSMAQS